MWFLVDGRTVAASVSVWSSVWVNLPIPPQRWSDIEQQARACLRFLLQSFKIKQE